MANRFVQPLSIREEGFFAVERFQELTEAALGGCLAPGGTAGRGVGAASAPELANPEAER